MRSLLPISKRYALLALAVLFLWSIDATAATTGKIAGTVVDETGAPLPGVQVVVEDTSPLKGAVTGADGFYQILNIEPGEYAVTFRYIGYADVRVENVEVVVDVTVQLNAEMREAVVEGDADYGLLIGRRGQTIDALQLLCYQAAFLGYRERKRVIVDAAGYRERRRESLVSRADVAAEQVLRSGRVAELDPMSAQERRVIHEHLKDRSGVETYSEGDEPQRYVVVSPLVTK